LGINVPGIDGQPVAAQAAAPQQQQQQQQQQQTVYQDEEGRPVQMNRKMRRMQERESRKEANKEERGSGRRAKRVQKASPAASGTATPQVQGQGAGPVGPKKRVVAENGKVLVVDSMGDVYLEEEDEDGNVAEYLLDVSPLFTRYGRTDFADPSSLMNFPSRRSRTPPWFACPSGCSASPLAVSCRSVQPASLRSKPRRPLLRRLRRTTRTLSRAGLRLAAGLPKTLRCSRSQSTSSAGPSPAGTTRRAAR